MFMTIAIHQKMSITINFSTNFLKCFVEVNMAATVDVVRSQEWAIQLLYGVYLCISRHLTMYAFLKVSITN